MKKLKKIMGASEIRPFAETGEHSYHRRAFAHDYHAPFIYHIILKKTKSCESFGSIIGDARIAPGNHGCATIKESELGMIIAKAIIHLPYEFPIIKMHKFCVMPDHVHLLLQLLFWSDKDLDFYIDALRTRIVSKYSIMKGTDICDDEVFETGYCDKPLYDNRSLDGLYRYIGENPHRLAMRRQFPQFFQMIRNLKIGDREYEAYGNLFLFRNPDKEAVKISRSFTPEEVEEKKSNWIADASKGTVLVSPFISKKEKEIRSEAEKAGASIILIVAGAFSERYKPGLHDFSLCSEGRLLIISYGVPTNTAITRQLCDQMNLLSSKIAKL